MSDVIIIGKRLVPRQEVALVEPYEPREDSRIQSPRNFLARIILTNRESILIEESAEAFAGHNGLRMIAADRTALNPSVRFRVETFQPDDDFKPSKAFKTRLKWSDFDGNEQSKLLVSEPEAVLAVTMAQASDEPAAKLPPASSARSSRPRRARPRPRSQQSPEQT